MKEFELYEIIRRQNSIILKSKTNTGRETAMNKTI